MGDLTLNFSRHEFACKCGCGFDTVDWELLSFLEELRDDMGGSSITITSGCRCLTHNLAVDGWPTSQHLKGRAADIVIDGVEPSAVYEWLDNRLDGYFGLGKYNNFTHLDTRSGEKARW